VIFVCRLCAAPWVCPRALCSSRALTQSRGWQLVWVQVRVAAWNLLSVECAGRQCCCQQMSASSGAPSLHCAQRCTSVTDGRRIWAIHKQTLFSFLCPLSAACHPLVPSQSAAALLGCIVHCSSDTQHSLWRLHSSGDPQSRIM
jgi:hypothetical protein